MSRWYKVGLLLVVLLAAALRLGGITRVGIRFDDEGAYVGDARLWHRCLLTVTDADALGDVVRHDKKAFQRRLQNHGVDFTARYRKPVQGYTFIGAATMFLAGDRPAALLMLNAVCGVLTVLVIYWIGSSLFSRSVGLAAALLLAVSPYHLLYCRSAFTDATATFFAYLGLALWVLGVRRGWSVRRTYALSGLTIGYAATCHYRVLYLLGVLIVADLVRLLQTHPRPETVRTGMRTAAVRWSWLILGAVLPAVCIELVFQGARLAATVTDSYLPLITYFGSAWRCITHEFTAGARLSYEYPVTLWHTLHTYMGYYLHWHGLALGLLVVLGLSICLGAKGIAKLPAIAVIVTLALLLTQPYIVARAMSTAIPALCLCSAVGLSWILQYRRPTGGWKVSLVVIVLAVCVAPASVHSLGLYTKQSSIVDACAFVVSQNDGAVAVALDTHHRSKYHLYLEGTGLDVVNTRLHADGSPKDAIARLRARGVRWMFVDPQHWHFRQSPPGPGNQVFQWWDTLGDYLSREATLAAEFPHITGFEWEFLTEGPGLAHLDEMIERKAGTLRIYDISALTGSRSALMNY